MRRQRVCQAQTQFLRSLPVVLPRSRLLSQTTHPAHHLLDDKHKQYAFDCKRASIHIHSFNHAHPKRIQENSERSFPIINTMKTVTVYGATSYTGSTHLLPYLDTNYAGQVHLVIAGRNRAKLDALNATLSGSNEKHRSVAALTLDDPEAVKALVDRSDVIINLAGKSLGPFLAPSATCVLRVAPCRSSGAVGHSMLRPSAPPSESLAPPEMLRRFRLLAPFPWYLRALVCHAHSAHCGGRRRKVSSNAA